MIDHHVEEEVWVCQNFIAVVFVFYVNLGNSDGVIGHGHGHGHVMAWGVNIKRRERVGNPTIRVRRRKQQIVS